MTTSDKKNTVDFGFQKVSPKEKTEKVANVFHSVAQKYDVMNDVMSLGVHRVWKKMVLDMANVRPGHRILDLASGTGDLALSFSRQVGEKGQVVLSDINASMLEVARSRFIDKGIIHNVDFVLANAEALPFPDNYFDRVTIAFGLRNVTTKENALREMHRVLNPGGYALILEFSHVTIKPLQKLYDLYSFNLIPQFGEWITGDRTSYQYLVESIRKHPDQETLKNMMTDAGFEDASYHNLSAGVVAVHKGYKY